MKKIELKELAVETKYSLSQLLPPDTDSDVSVGYSIFKMVNVWQVAQNNCGYMFPFKVMDTTYGNQRWNTLKEAEDELLAVLADYQTPLTKKEIKKYFNEEWISTEEEYGILKTFRIALLDSRWELAKVILTKKFSTWTWEAIPNKVKFQIALHNL